MSTLFKHLCGYAERGRISFAMPGHKGGRGLSADFKARISQIDVTELADTESPVSYTHLISYSLVSSSYLVFMDFTISFILYHKF